MSEYICNVCGKEVSKRQSLAFNGGRACRSHSEAEQAKQDRILADEKKKQEEERRIADKQKRFSERQYNQTHQFEDFVKGPQCWCCRKAGIHAQEHWMRMMVANQKLMLLGKSPLDTEALVAAYGEPQRILLQVPVKETHFIVDHIREGKMLHNLSGGIVFVCYECANVHHLGEQWKDIFAPKATTEQIMNMAAIVDSMPMSIISKEIAKIEVEKGI